MRIRPASLGAAILLLALAAPGFADSNVAYDKRTDFSRYQTYAWKSGDAAPDPAMQARIVNALEAALETKGLRKTAGTPDLYIFARAAVYNEHYVRRNELGYSGFLWREGIWAPGPDDIYRIPALTLRLDLFDRVSLEPVWRAHAVNLLSAKRWKRIEESGHATWALLKKLPR
jgi:hypothetical protein